MWLKKIDSTDSFRHGLT